MSFEMRLDVSRCIGCRACEVACVTANDLPPAHSRNWVDHLEASGAVRARATFVPHLCAHCEEPPCVPACPTGASYQADDGRVLVDRALCIGCGMCVPACPYDARHVEPETNELEKCTLCEGRVRAERPPACFEVCPAGARHVAFDGAPAVSVGDPERLDPGTRAEKLVTAEVDPGPRLSFSGTPDDLALLRARRPPRQSGPVAGAIWRNGAGWLVQGLGVAAAAAMAGMIGLRAIRGRLARPAAADDHEEEKDA